MRRPSHRSWSSAGADPPFLTWQVEGNSASRNERRTSGRSLPRPNRGRAITLGCLDCLRRLPMSWICWLTCQDRRGSWFGSAGRRSRRHARRSTQRRLRDQRTTGRQPRRTGRDPGRARHSDRAAGQSLPGPGHRHHAATPHPRPDRRAIHGLGRDRATDRRPVRPGRHQRATAPARRHREPPGRTPARLGRPARPLRHRPRPGGAAGHPAPGRGTTPCAATRAARGVEAARRAERLSTPPSCAPYRAGPRSGRALSSCSTRPVPLPLKESA